LSSVNNPKSDSDIISPVLLSTNFTVFHIMLFYIHINLQK